MFIEAQRKPAIVSKGEPVIHEMTRQNEEN